MLIEISSLYIFIKLAIFLEKKTGQISFLGASLIWSNVILLLFKFKRCGPLPSTEGACGPSKAPLLDESYEPMKVQSTKGDQVLV